MKNPARRRNRREPVADPLFEKNDGGVGQLVEK